MKKKIVLIFGVLIFGICNSVYAQFPNGDGSGSGLFDEGPDPPPDFQQEEDGPDPPPTPAAPINDYLLVLLAVGITVGYLKTHRKSNSTKLD